ncbi:MAG: hypothetical protein L6427_00620 [Actinomycetia bacterium]|nr:hypothetical protein [Actinomycetes bacterium]
MKDKDNDGKQKVKSIVRTLILLVAAGVVVMLIYLNIAPFGAKIVLEIGSEQGSEKVEVVRPFSSSSILTPGDNGSAYQIPRLKMITDEVSLKVEVPYPSFSEAVAEIKYHGDPDSLLLGVRGPETSEYRIEPVHNKGLNNLSWDRVDNGSLTLFQKEKEFNTVEEFLKMLPSIVEADIAEDGQSRVATYAYSPRQPAPKIDISKANESITIDATLRGPHTFFVYITDKASEFSLVKQELNWYEGEDPLTINFYKDDALVFSEAVPDDGDISASKEPSSPREVDIQLPRLEEGVYRVELDCYIDVLMRDIFSSQRYLSFFDRVFLVDHEHYEVGPSKPVTLYTDAQEFIVETWHPGSSQTIVVNGEEQIGVNEFQKRVTEGLSEPVNVIETEMGDIVIESPDSFFAFSEDSLFDPFPLKTETYSGKVSPADLDYIIAHYMIPREKGEWFSQTVTINLEGVEPMDNQLDFALRAPGLTRDGGEIIIGSLVLTIDRP